MSHFDTTSLEYLFLDPFSLSAEFVTLFPSLNVALYELGQVMQEGLGRLHLLDPSLKEAPLGARTGLKACTSCCHATVRQNPGYQTQLIHHLLRYSKYSKCSLRVAQPFAFHEVA